MSIEIRQHTPGKHVKDFIQTHYEIYQGHPVWIPPLSMELRERLDPAKNPFFEVGPDQLGFVSSESGGLYIVDKSSID